MKNIIAFSGFIKAGKSQAAQFLIDINPNFKLKSFAEPLKESFAQHKKIRIENLYDIKEKEKYRQELIEFANEMRKKDPFIFANQLFDSINEEDNIVIDDLRLLPELEMLVKAGGKPYRVWADHNTRKKRGWVSNYMIDRDLTETDLDLSQETYCALGGGYVFNNTDNLEALRRRIFELLSDIL